jgi:hypothetical protein
MQEEEYKSKAYEKMLKDRGIEILQSIPICSSTKRQS